MAPKKKGGKKDDDWDADLGETADPIAQAETEAKQADDEKDAEDEESLGGGGLLAALKKNRGKKAKKGKIVEDFVEGEDPPDANGADGEDTAAGINLENKAPQEATMDDEDVFAAPGKKGKGGKSGGKQIQQQKQKKDEDDEDAEEDADDGGKMKTKKEKEKEKKEREKQRKKEQVWKYS